MHRSKRTRPSQRPSSSSMDCRSAQIIFFMLHRRIRSRPPQRPSVIMIFEYHLRQSCTLHRQLRSRPPQRPSIISLAEYQLRQACMLHRRKSIGPPQRPPIIPICLIFQLMQACMLHRRIRSVPPQRPSSKLVCQGFTVSCPGLQGNGPRRRCRGLTQVLGVISKSIVYCTGHEQVGPCCRGLNQILITSFEKIYVVQVGHPSAPMEAFIKHCFYEIQIAYPIVQEEKPRHDTAPKVPLVLHSY